MKKYDKVMIANVALLLADVRSACILGDESFTELVVKSFSELDSMKRSSNVSMLYRRGSMTKKTWKSSKQHHHLFLKYSCNEESIKLHGNSVSVTSSKIPLISWHPSTRKTIISNWPSTVRK
jgi:hypothetical protein